jgi:hypothetical protein
MGSTRYKVTYKCDCGEFYGSCEKRSFFIFDYNRSIDVGALAWKRHADDPDSLMKNLGTFSDNALSALINVLTQEHASEICTAEENEEFDSIKYT